MVKVVAYCRYSSDSQRDESIAAQIRAIEDYCKKNNYTLIKIYKDVAVSGTSVIDRDQLIQMIEDSKQKTFDYVIVHKFDRFARNIYDHAIYEKKLNDNGVKLLSVLEQLNDSPESVILKSVLTGMNEYYSLNLRREVKKGLKENALKGIHTVGIPPLGYDLDENRKYIINEKEAEMVRLIFHLKLEGYGNAHIAAELNERGFKNKRGLPFRKSSIRDTLMNMKYIGTYYHGLKDGKGKLQENPIIIENSHSPIIEKDIFYRIQQKFKERKNGPRKRKDNNYFLTGLCRCGECGGPYSGGYRSINRNKTVSYGYECRKRRAKENNCRNKPIRKEVLENYIFNIIQEEILTSYNIEKMTKDIMKYLGEKIKGKEETRKNYKKKLDNLKIKKDKLLNVYLEGKISKEEFNEKNKEINWKELILKENNSSFDRINKIKEDSVRNYLLSIKKDFDNDQLKKSILETFIYQILIFDNRIEITLRKFPSYLDMVKVGGSGGN